MPRPKWCNLSLFLTYNFIHSCKWIFHFSLAIFKNIDKNVLGNYSFQKKVDWIKENIVLSCPLWLLYRGTANQSANQWMKSWVKQSIPSLYFLSNAAAAQAASATAQNSKRGLRAFWYKTLCLYTLWTEYNSVQTAGKSYAFKKRNP